FRGGRRGLFFVRFSRLRDGLAALRRLPWAVEPRLAGPPSFGGILPREELRPLDLGDRVGPVLLLGPADDGRAERVAPEEIGVVFFQGSAREVRPEALVDQVR